MNHTLNCRETFIWNILSLTSVEPAVQTFLYDHLRIEEHRKREVLFSPGKMNDQLYFVHSGLVRSYYVALDERGNDRNTTAFFAPESNFAISPSSFFNQRPTKEGVTVLEDSVLVSISYQEIQKLYEMHPSASVIGQKITERYLLYYHELAHGLRLPTGKKKYEWFLKRFPELRGRVQNKDVASFLGLTDQSLTRILGRKGQ